ncbi:MAG: hypothetical protein WCS38_07185, partial [Mesotoga sp.]
SPALRPGMFLAGIATWAVLAQPCVYCFILPRASEPRLLGELSKLSTMLFRRTGLRSATTTNDSYS